MATLLDRRLYDAAQGKGGPWAIDVDKETSEPLRVRYDGDPIVGMASVLREIKETMVGTHQAECSLSSGRRARSAEAALKRARAEWAKAMADRKRWGLEDDGGDL